MSYLRREIVREGNYSGEENVLRSGKEHNNSHITIHREYRRSNQYKSSQVGQSPKCETLMTGRLAEVTRTELDMGPVGSGWVTNSPSWVVELCRVQCQKI